MDPAGLHLRPSVVEYPVSSGGDIVGPTIFGHSATASGLSVAAVPYSAGSVPTTTESFSSPGPAAHYFGPVIAITPAITITPVTIDRPSFSATDGGCTTFFGGYENGCDRFYGTSAASPHAAAVAALLKQESAHILLSLEPRVCR